MQTARAFVGLKDHPSETGVGWEGSLFGRERIQFRFGAEEYALGEYPDTVSRTLIDGWRPGVVVEGRMHNLQVRETVFAVPMGAESRPVVFIRLSVRNLSSQRRNDWVEAVLSGERAGEVQLNRGILARGSDAILLSQLPAVAGELPGSLRVAFTLQPGEERHIDFIHPQDTNAPVSAGGSSAGAPHSRRRWPGFAVTGTRSWRRRPWWKFPRRGSIARSRRSWPSALSAATGISCTTA